LQGICYTLYTSNTNALVQLATPGYLQGRVAGLYSYIFSSTNSFGGLLAGALADHGGTQLAFLVGGGTALVFAVFGLIFRWHGFHQDTTRAEISLNTSLASQKDQSKFDE
jgi:MFS family permease